ncbi:helix-turn-helix domain-containing protein [Mycoplasmopsis gallinacea]|uniref:Transposase n=1 Tax=Mycoplasmopsis gallinacea TaxID=29556 RepID=A0A6H0V2G6_9BACT|nr:helix-turn-helix domain-containing protein [Mycoplasmopsis gallinacea]QIW62168.1 hypothetical protein GOQ20_01785 [Mycoplasmopsis gallinacea]
MIKLLKRKSTEYERKLTKRLRFLEEHKDWSNVKIAKKLGVSPESVRKWRLKIEKGEEILVLHKNRKNTNASKHSSEELNEIFIEYQNFCNTQNNFKCVPLKQYYRDYLQDKIDISYVQLFRRFKTLGLSSFCNSKKQK